MTETIAVDPKTTINKKDSRHGGRGAKTGMYNVLIVDDHAIVRRGLKQIMESQDSRWRVAEASDGAEAMQQVRSGYWDVVVLDISMPGKNGLDVLKQLKKERPSLPVLMLSIHPEDHYAVRMIKAGASGYLTKDAAPDRLVEAVNAVREGRRYITPSLAEKLAIELGAGHELPPHQLLSDREYQIFRLIASGNTVSDVARILSLSVKTVSTHRMRILRKMQLKNNAEITHYAMKYTLVD